MTQASRVILSALGVFAAGLAIIITISHFNARLRDLEDKYAGELVARVAELREENKATKVELDAALSQEKQRLEAKIDAIGAPPTPTVIADLVIGQHLPAVADIVAQRLVEDYADDLRGVPGRDADVVELARTLASTEAYPRLIQAVGEEIWATRARNILGDPVFIATIASKVHEQYGKELGGGEMSAEMVATIAQMLAGEPNFAELVAAEQRLRDKSP
jgi:hypothetical protein